MNVNQLMAALRAEQKMGHGKVDVHFIAHDNSLGESQGLITGVVFYEKDPTEEDGYGGRDVELYNSTPTKIVYVK